MEYATLPRFSELSQRVGVPDLTARKIFADLVSHYTEDHRKYHNLSHIDRMLGWLEAAGGRMDAVEFAIWFHDVVYQPLGSDNEAESARYFRDCLGSDLPGPFADAVARLILATDSARPRTGGDDENLIIDIDLSILGASPEHYAAYREAIRCEYSAVPEDQFIAGRSAILQRFLTQRIYSTDFFSRLEKQARLNIENELLTHPPGT
jgi:predicted metal-dependent HD superfamily phosphohydrolase